MRQNSFCKSGSTWTIKFTFRYNSSSMFWWDAYYQCINWSCERCIQKCKTCRSGWICFASKIRKARWNEYESRKINTWRLKVHGPLVTKVPRIRFLHLLASFWTRPGNWGYTRVLWLWKGLYCFWFGWKAMREFTEEERIRVSKIKKVPLFSVLFEKQ